MSLIKKIIQIYLNSWWIPIFLTVVFTVYLLFINTSSNTISLFYILLIFVFGMLAASIWNFVKRKRAKAIINLAVFLVFAGTIYYFIFISTILFNGFKD